MNRDAVVNFLSGLVVIAVMLPVVAVLAGLSVRIFRAVAGL